MPPADNHGEIPRAQGEPRPAGGWAERGSVSIFQQKSLASGCTRPAFE